MNKKKYKVIKSEREYKMNEIVNFVKEILMLESSQKMPVGLCAFENDGEEKPKREIKQKRKTEMRLSELMDR